MPSLRMPVLVLLAAVLPFGISPARAEDDSADEEEGFVSLLAVRIKELE